MRPPTVRRAGKLAGAWVLFATAAFAQSPPPSQTVTAWPPQWTVSAGVESLWWRDVARSGPPVWASPIAWEGQGPVVYVSYDRGSRPRLHHFEGSFSVSGGFELRSPVRTTAAADGDRASRFGGRYEYRRYPWRDLWTTGFDVGIGVDGSAEHLSYDRQLEPAIELQRSVNDLGTSFVVAGRWQRSARWSLLAAWANGLSIGRSNLRYRSDAVETAQQQWGGGWLSRLELRGDVRVAPRALLTAAWITTGEGRHAHHDSFTFGRSQFTAGVVYGR